MEVGTQTKLTFHGVDILNVNFNTIAQRNDSMNINLSCLPKVFYPIDNDNFFKIIMDIELKDERFFDLSIRAIGNFELDKNINEELRKTFINSNAPAIMFPYIRSFITTLTANMGNVIGPLFIPTQFFKGELEEVKE